MLTTAQAAKRLHVSPQAIHKAIARGRLKARERRGTYYLIAVRDLSAYAKSRLH